MSNLPLGWAETTLGEIVTLRGDKVDPGSVPEKSFIGLEDIEPHTSAILRVGQASKVKSSVACFEAGDVLYSRLRPYLNKVTCPDFSGVASAEILALVPSDAAEADFVRRKVMTRAFLDFTAMLDKGDRPRVSYDEIAGFPFPLPPLTEQRRIVAKIDSLTGKSRCARDHLDYIPRLVEKYKEAILAAAFRGDLTREWRELHGEGSWRDVSVSDLSLSLFDGPFGSNLKSSDYAEQGIRVVRLENIGHLRFVRDKETFVSNEKYAGLTRHTLKPNDILVSSFVADEMRVCLFPDDLETLAINKADCFCIRPDINVVIPKFAELRLASSRTYKALEEAVHGATRPRISLSQLRSFRFDLPSLEEQVEIVRRIQSAFAWTDRLCTDVNGAHKLIDHLDQSVLAKAFKGELVSQDPTDEPASALLDRIRAERAAAPKAKRGRKKAA